MKNKQKSFGNSGFEISPKRTRKREFLDEMNRVIPWLPLVTLVAQYSPKGETGRPPYEPELLLRVYLLQQFFGLSDPAMEEALHDVPLYCEFARLDVGCSKVPDESTILRFRHLIERHGVAAKILDTVNAELVSRRLLLKTGTVVDATLINAPSSTKNNSGERDPEMKQTKKGNQWHFGMKAHIGVDAESGLVHTVTTTSANVHDVTQAAELLHGEEEMVFGDAGYRGAEKREEVKERFANVKWLVAMMPGKRRRLTDSEPDRITDLVEEMKASVRAKVEHPFRVIKCQFGYRKARYRGLAKNTSQLITLFALSNLWMVRKRIFQCA